MENPSSPLETLRQLKEMLDAGALTPTEFEALKQQLVFSAGSPAPAPAAGPPTPAATPAPVPPPAAAPVPPPTSAPVLPPPLAEPPVIIHLRSPAPGGARRTADVAPAVPPPAPPRAAEPVVPPAPPVVPTPPVVPPVAPRAAPLPPPVAPAPPPPPRVSPPAFSTAPAPEPLPQSNWVNNEFPEAEAPRSRNPLALILSIGGLLALLGLVLYLSMNRRPSEHLSSTSQTAADSVATTIETGPQAEQLPSPAAAAAETVRVRPAAPAPPVRRRLAPTVRDTVAVPPAPDSASGNY